MTIHIMVIVKNEDDGNFLAQQETVPDARGFWMLDILTGRAVEKMRELTHGRRNDDPAMHCGEKPEHEPHPWNAEYVAHGPYWCSGNPNSIREIEMPDWFNEWVAKQEPANAHPETEPK